MKEIKKAQNSELNNVLDFYTEVVEQIQKMPFNRVWRKGGYPEPEFIQGFIENGELYLMNDGTEIIAAMALNHTIEGYDDVKWKVQADADQVLVIHALAVSPDYMGKGYSKEMLRFAKETARRTGMKAIRLDVLPYNTPALKAYEGEGFEYIDTKTMHYGNSGIMQFKIYEYAI